MADLNEVFADTGAQLDRIIYAYERKAPPHPETIVEYADGSISSFNIVGELGENSIPNKANAVKVDIGNTVTSIESRAFEGCSGLTSITIPDGVTSIGYSAFYNCFGLTSITIPNGVTSIEGSTFAGCSRLTSIMIPAAVISIGSRAFYQCVGLVSVSIPDSVTSIGDSAFSSCRSLTSITIPDGVTNIGYSAFFSCAALSSITSLRTSAPTVQSNTFGNSDSRYTGRNTYSSENNVLKIPQGATGYDASYWLDPLQNASKCGFHIEYI